MKKKIISCLMVCIVIVLSYFYAYIDKNTYIYDRNADTSTFWGTGILKEGDALEQTFIAEEDTIEGINLKVSVLGNAEDVVLHYTLIDVASGDTYESTIQGSVLENNKFNQLQTPQITETKGRAYRLVLSEENSDVQNGIGFYVEPEKYENQSLTVKEDVSEGTLVVRTISHRFDVETFVVLLGMIAFIVVFMKILYKMFK